MVVKHLLTQAKECPRTSFIIKCLCEMLKVLSCFVITDLLGFCRVCVRSRCWDACMVVDGGTSFEFNDGAIASILIDTEDSLCTVLLEE